MRRGEGISIFCMSLFLIGIASPRRCENLKKALPPFEAAIPTGMTNGNFGLPQRMTLVGLSQNLNVKEKNKVAAISCDEKTLGTTTFKVGSNGMELSRLKTDCNYCNEAKYLNVSGEKENKDANNVASMIMHKVFTNFNIYNINSYINFSVNNDNVEDAPVALMVMHQPHELGLHGHPGSKLYLSGSPGWGASTFFCKTGGGCNGEK